MSIWYECQEPRSGLTFYHCRDTETSQWHRPEGGNVIPGNDVTSWWDIYDARYGRSYFHNTSTAETVWVKPEGVFALKVPRTEYVPVTAVRKGEEEEQNEDGIKEVEGEGFDCEDADHELQGCETKSICLSALAKASIPSPLAGKVQGDVAGGRRNTTPDPARPPPQAAALPPPIASSALKKSGARPLRAPPSLPSPIGGSGHVRRGSDLGRTPTRPLGTSTSGTRNPSPGSLGTPPKRTNASAADLTSPAMARAAALARGRANRKSRDKKQGRHMSVVLDSSPLPSVPAGATVVKRSEKSVQPPWAEYFDTKTQRYYYVNSDTGESTWNKAVATGSLDLYDGTSIDMSSKLRVATTVDEDEEESAAETEGEDDDDDESSEDEDEDEETSAEEEAKEKGDQEEMAEATPQETNAEEVQDTKRNEGSEISESVEGASVKEESASSSVVGDMVGKEKKRKKKSEKRKSKKDRSSKKKKRKGSRKGSQTPAAREESDLLPGWEKHFDPKWGTAYYYNSNTGESTWSRPVATGKLELMDGTSIALSPKDKKETKLKRSGDLSDATPKFPQPSPNKSSRKQGAASAPVLPLPQTLSPEEKEKALIQILTQSSDEETASAVETAEEKPKDNIPRAFTTELMTVDTTRSGTPAAKPAAVGRMRGRERSMTAGGFEGTTYSRAETMPQLPSNLQSDINQFQLEGYALKYFDNHRKGVFRRLVPVKEMLCYTKEPLQQALLKVVNDKFAKEAVKMFKQITKYMNENLGTRSKYTLAKDIVGKCIDIPELRDEAYCQAAKQTTANSSEQSCERGWEIITIFTAHFPPTRDLETWIHRYISEHKKSGNGRIAACAIHAEKKMGKICALGAKGRVPTLDEIERAANAPFSTTIFGVSLEEIMEQQAEKEPELPVPRILLVLADSIRNLGGLQTEGIFRVPGDMEAVAALRVQVEANDYDLKPKDPHSPASLLKLWMRELSEPIIPPDLYEDCVSAANDKEAALKTLERLPEVSRATIQFVVTFLQEAALPENRAKTKMSISNLAMVFAPNFLRCPSSDPTVIFRNTKFEQEFLIHLINAEGRIQCPPTPRIDEIVE